MNTIKYFLCLLFPLIVGGNCQSQQSDNKKDNALKNRGAVVAGKFYSGNKAELQRNLKNFFTLARPIEKNGEPIALIVPHAGYVFSGEVAAWGFKQLDKNKEFENIFVIGSSHRAYFEGASIYNKGNYVTPLGEVKVNIELANKLINEYDVFDYQPQAHNAEHSLEVELPFLQYHLKKDFRIVPIVLGTQSKAKCEKIAKALQPFFNTNNLFVISTDFSHYPKYSDAIEIDKQTMQAIISKKPENLIHSINENKKKDIPNLATSLCGWTSVLTLLNIIENDQSISAVPVKYMNSGDCLQGERNRVVGYYSILFTKKKDKSDMKTQNNDFSLSTTDKKQLLNIARETIKAHVADKELPELKPENYSDVLKKNCGAFVTLHKDGKLRGCIGRFYAEEPLYKVVQEVAISSAVKDTRFTPVTTDEVDELEIEISVLTPMKKIESTDEIELGKHGIYIKKGYMGGTFLPQVATETGWNKEEFLGHCSRDKAGIGWFGWKEADVYIYEAKVFSEKEVK